MGLSENNKTLAFVNIYFAMTYHKHKLSHLGITYPDKTGIRENSNGQKKGKGKKKSIRNIGKTGDK